MAGLVGVVGLLVGLTWLSSHVAALTTVLAVYSLWALGRLCDQGAHRTTVGATSMIVAGILITEAWRLTTCIRNEVLQIQEAI